MSREPNEKIKRAIDGEIHSRTAHAREKIKDAYYSKTSKEAADNLRESKKNLTETVEKIDEIVKILDTEG